MGRQGVEDWSKKAAIWAGTITNIISILIIMIVSIINIFILIILIIIIFIIIMIREAINKKKSRFYGHFPYPP